VEAERTADARIPAKASAALAAAMLEAASVRQWVSPATGAQVNQLIYKEKLADRGGRSGRVLSFKII
jgi:hypothetical protein